MKKILSLLTLGSLLALLAGCGSSGGSVEDTSGSTPPSTTTTDEGTGNQMGTPTPTATE